MACQSTRQRMSSRAACAAAHAGVRRPSAKTRLDQAPLFSREQRSPAGAGIHPPSPGAPAACTSGDPWRAAWPPRATSATSRCPASLIGSDRSSSGRPAVGLYERPRGSRGPIRLPARSSPASVTVVSPARRPAPADSTPHRCRNPTCASRSLRNVPARWSMSMEPHALRARPALLPRARDRLPPTRGSIRVFSIVTCSTELGDCGSGATAGEPM